MASVYKEVPLKLDLEGVRSGRKHNKRLEVLHLFDTYDKMFTFETAEYPTFFSQRFMSKLPAAQHFDSQKDLCCFKTAVAIWAWNTWPQAIPWRFATVVGDTGNQHSGGGPDHNIKQNVYIDLDCANHLLHQLTWFFGGGWLKGYSPHVSRQCFVALQCGHSILRPRNVLSSSAPEAPDFFKWDLLLTWVTLTGS